MTPEQRIVLIEWANAAPRLDAPDLGDAIDAALALVDELRAERDALAKRARLAETDLRDALDERNYQEQERGAAEALLEEAKGVVTHEDIFGGGKAFQDARAAFIAKLNSREKP